MFTHLDCSSALRTLAKAKATRTSMPLDMSIGNNNKILATSHLSFITHQFRS